MTRHRPATRSCVLAAFLTFGFIASARADGPINKTILGGLAVKGADAVAYFADSKTVMGDKKYEYEWQGVKWRFASKEHLDLFTAGPAKYAPQYGGYCAWAAAQGKKADIDPEAWRIVDGKLYLNYSKKIQAQWEKALPEIIQKADKAWPGIADY